MKYFLKKNTVFQPLFSSYFMNEAQSLGGDGIHSALFYGIRKKAESLPFKKVVFFIIIFLFGTLLWGEFGVKNDHSSWGKSWTFRHLLKRSFQQQASKRSLWKMLRAWLECQIKRFKVPLLLLLLRLCVPICVCAIPWKPTALKKWVKMEFFFLLMVVRNP